MNRLAVVYLVLGMVVGIGSHWRSVGWSQDAELEQVTIEEYTPLQQLRDLLASPNPPSPQPTPTIYKTPSAIQTPQRRKFTSPRTYATEPAFTLEDLPLMPDRDLALRMDGIFRQKVRLVNLRIQERQQELHHLLEDWTTDPDTIRQIQKDLSELRTERDRLALEHLLLMRQLERHFVIPRPQASSSPLSQSQQE